MRALTLVALLGSLAACNPASSPPTTNAGTSGTAAVTPSPSPGGATPTGSGATPSGEGAVRVGSPAPDFTLRDLDGREVSLASLRGKRVVLEWFNPDCPFVKASHTVGSLKTLAAEATAKGVVWLAINSGGPGKQGHGVEANRAGVERYHLSHPILLDPDGAVGKRYGAKRTPQMFVVDERGVIVYQGAIDNSPDGEGQSPEGGKLVNHVAEALAALEAGKPVPVAETKPYGCTVKYAP
ncbi:MAG: redoxin family protein [Deltaproteobacteria bacterium]|nr:redoxin family protein [Deltaproteobacteria bacterium]